MTSRTKKISQTESIVMEQHQLESFIRNQNKELVELFEEKFNRFEESLQDIKGKLNKMANLFDIQENKKTTISKKIQNVDLVLRKNSLRIDGVREEDNENICTKSIDIITSILGVKCEEKYINDVFRLGKFEDRKSRTIILKLRLL